jgi:hypothetical protein
MKNYYYTVSSRWQSGEIEIVSERLQRRDEIALKCNDFFLFARLLKLKSSLFFLAYIKHRCRCRVIARVIFYGLCVFYAITTFLR